MCLEFLKLRWRTRCRKRSCHGDVVKIFLDNRRTKINQYPMIGNKDIYLYKLFRAVYHKLAGYNRVTNQNQFKSIAKLLGFWIQNNLLTMQWKMLTKCTCIVWRFLRVVRLLNDQSSERRSFCIAKIRS